ncbi:hypothetical protein [Embleya sp. NPDC001921]
MRPVPGYRLTVEPHPHLGVFEGAAQRLGFTLDEVAELLEAGGHHHGAGRRAEAGLQELAATKLVAAGLLGGGALAVAAWLPTVAVVLAVAAVLLVGRAWWRRRRSTEAAHGCTGSSCGCGNTAAAGSAIDVSVGSRP